MYGWIGNDKNPGCGWAIFMTIALSIGSVFLSIQSCRVERTVDAAIAEDFEVIWLYEHDPDMAEEMAEACKGKYKISEPVSMDADGGRNWYAVTKMIGGEYTQPRFIQVTEYGGHVLTTPVYEVFKGPGAADKMRGWLKKNRYTQSDFKIDRGVGKGATDHVMPKKGRSQVGISAYMEIGSEIYLWDGTSVDHLKNEEYIRPYLDKMLKIAH